mmetsp:Transcript_146244/g.266641  ORF Transcript_146244/g.266641 Transcript_146244/m.266641 type:complete len:349 (-) Transcript_146244:535-1581(-)
MACPWPNTSVSQGMIDLIECQPLAVIVVMLVKNLQEKLPIVLSQLLCDSDEGVEVNTTGLICILLDSLQERQANSLIPGHKSTLAYDLRHICCRDLAFAIAQECLVHAHNAAFPGVDDLRTKAEGCGNAACLLLAFALCAFLQQTHQSLKALNVEDVTGHDPASFKILPDCDCVGHHITDGIAHLLLIWKCSHQPEDFNCLLHRQHATVVGVCFCELRLQFLMLQSCQRLPYLRHDFGSELIEADFQLVDLPKDLSDGVPFFFVPPSQSEIRKTMLQLCLVERVAAICVIKLKDTIESLLILLRLTEESCNFAGPVPNQAEWAVMLQQLWYFSANLMIVLMLTLLQLS